jgi:hypothetical protein
VVEEKGDTFRDTVALTVRGDGIDIPPYVITGNPEINGDFFKFKKCFILSPARLFSI